MGKRQPDSIRCPRRAGRTALTLLVACWLPAAPARAAEAPPFEKMNPSDDVRLLELTVSGLHEVSRAAFLSSIWGLRSGALHKVRHVLDAEKRVRDSGWFARVQVTYTVVPDSGVRVALALTENPVLTNIKIGGDMLANLEVLDRLFREREVLVGRIFNEVRIAEAMQRFKEHYQEQGHFLFQVRWKAKQEASSEEGWLRQLLRVSDEPVNDPVYLKLYFFKVAYLHIKKITVVGNDKTAERTILRRLAVRVGQTIEGDAPLAESLLRLRRLGIFSYVFFDIRQAGMFNEAEIVVRVTEIDSDLVNPSISLNQRGEFNLELDYFNYSLGENLARLSGAAIFDYKTEELNFVFQYTLPWLARDWFLDVAFSKDSRADPYDTDWERRTDRLNLVATLGRRFGQRFSAYGILNNNVTVISYEALSAGNPALPAGVERSKRYLDRFLKLALMLDTLDDNFYPLAGVRSVLSYTVSLFGDFDNYSVVDHKIEAYFPLVDRFSFCLYGHTSALFTSDPDVSLALEDRRRTTAQDVVAEALAEKRFTAYAILEFRWRFYDQYALCAYAESAGAWATPGAASFASLAYGIGLGLRMAPRQHYSAHVFKYPWSVNIGFNISHPSGGMSYSVVSARDEYYYINLQASF